MTREQGGNSEIRTSDKVGIAERHCRKAKEGIPSSTGNQARKDLIESETPKGKQAANWPLDLK
ncbi:hypothetical protein, partial [Streptomyces jumonjinensis]|uniref:hypothetical protein n=1 Tax=Streptomyces jumonjinensis TaxID=1945 RepID=UPI0037BD8CDF